MEHAERTYWEEYKEISQSQTNTARRVLGEYGTKAHIDELTEELDLAKLAFINGCPADSSNNQDDSEAAQTRTSSLSIGELASNTPHLNALGWKFKIYSPYQI